MGWTQEGVAKALGMAQPAVSHAEAKDESIVGSDNTFISDQRRKISGLARIGQRWSLLYGMVKAGRHGFEEID